MNYTYSRVLLLVFLITSSCIAQDVSDEITPQAIEERIARYRMGEIIVKTSPAARVRIQQKRHEFLFGTAIANQLVEEGPAAMSLEDKQMYLKVLSENFNYAVHENALKWYDCEKEPNVIDYSKADKIWQICNELNIPMRGHCIFWAKDKYIQPWIKRLNNDELRRAVKRRAIDVTRHFKGRIEEFDLNNEMIHGDFFRRRLGYGIINEMAFMAKAGNPDAVLYVNDYGVIVLGYNARTYVTQIRNLLANGVPIGGIGCQGHFSSRYPTSAEHIQRTLNQLAEFNLPIKITECDFNFEDEQTKAEELRKVFRICFAHPAVKAIVMWGFWEGTNWIPRASLWKKDWSPTPAALAYRDIVFNQWWTQTSGQADENGIFRTRAFYGDYKITSNGQSKRVKLSSSKGCIEVKFE